MQSGKLDSLFERQNEASKAVLRALICTGNCAYPDDHFLFSKSLEDLREQWIIDRCESEAMNWILAAEAAKLAWCRLRAASAGPQPVTAEALETIRRRVKLAVNAVEQLAGDDDCPDRERLGEWYEARVQRAEIAQLAYLCQQV